MNAIVRSFFVGFIALTLSIFAYAVDEESIIGYWPCDEGKGQVVADAIGGAEGTMMVGFGWAGKPHDQGWGEGKFDSGLVFDPMEQWFVRVKKTNALGEIGEPDTVFTVAFWVKTTVKGEKIRAIDKGSLACSTRGWHVGICCGGFPFAEVSADDGVDPACAGFHAPMVLVADGEWHHVAYVFKVGNAVSTYVDGKLSKKAGTHSEKDLSNKWHITFGTIGALNEGPAPGGGQYFDGSMDDIAIFNRGLTEQEIEELAAGPVVEIDKAVDVRNKLVTTWANIKGTY